MVRSSSQLDCLDSSSALAFSTSLESDLICFSFVYSSRTFNWVWACSRSKSACCLVSSSARLVAIETYPLAFISVDHLSRSMARSLSERARAI